MRRQRHLLTGRQNGDRDAAVIVELKQWSTLEAVPTKDAIVRTFVGGAHREVSHPCYQAWSYARMIEDYNEVVKRKLTKKGAIHRLRRREASGQEHGTV